MIQPSGCRRSIVTAVTVGITTRNRGDDEQSVRTQTRIAGRADAANK